MIKKLLIVFVSGLALSIVSLSGAWVVGGQTMLARIERDGFLDFSVDDDDRGPQTSRSLPFAGNQLLTIDAPVSLTFTRGPEAKMTVSGAASVLDRLRWENGALSLSGEGQKRYGRLAVTITAPQLLGLVLRGPGHAELNGLDQPSLLIDISGAADVEATGRVETLDIRASGLGSLDMEEVHARDARLSLSGVGSVDLDASGRVDADISGVGSLTLHRKPAVLNSNASGIGSINHDY